MGAHPEGLVGTQGDRPWQREVIGGTRVLAQERGASRQYSHHHGEEAVGGKGTDELLYEAQGGETPEPARGRPLVPAEALALPRE